MMKKMFFLAAALAATASLALVGCGDKAGSAHHEDTETGTYRGIESTESIFGLAAVTSAKLLAVTEAPAASVSHTESLAFTTEGTQDAVGKAQTEAENFNKYFNILDTFLDRSSTTTVVEDNTSEDATLAGYAFKLTITGRNAAGEDVPHTMYYSETKGETKTDSRRDDDETVTVTSTVYALDGVVEMGADAESAPVYYHMQGTRTEQTITETEGRETETEQVSTLSLRASLQGDTSDYVELTHTQSTEEEPGEAETEALYTYKTYVAGRLVESTSVEFETETEHGEEETEYTVRFLSGASRGVYEIERETENGRTEIAVKYSIDGVRGRFVIVKNADGTYRYKFSDNSADDEIFRDFYD